MWGDSGRQGGAKGDKTFGKADTPSNSTHVGRQWETRGGKLRQDPREGGHTIQRRHTCGETVGDSERQWEKRPAGRRTHHPTQAHMWGDSGRQGGAKGDKTFGKADTPSNSTHVGRQWETRGDKLRQDPREGGHIIQRRHTCGETVGDSERQWEKRPAGRRTHHPTQAHMWGDSGRRQWEKTVGEDSGRQGETRGDKWRQDPREGRHTILCRHTCGETVGDTRRQDPREGGHTIQHRHTCRQTVEDKRRQGETRPLGRRTHHPTQAHMWRDSARQRETRGDKARQGETRGNKWRQDPREGGHTIHYRHTCGETVGDKRRQGETRGNKWRQDPWEGRHTIQHRHTCAKTVGDKGRQGDTRGETHHPLQAHMWGDNWRQRRQEETSEDKTPGKADTPSNTGTQVGSQ